VSFDHTLTILALGGEVVLDYSIRAKREFPDVNLVVAGYSNDVMSYIPSLRILHEGGYEAEDSMVYYGQPGRFSDQVEEQVFELIHRTMAGVQ
jgi:neutral ceramidase